MEGVFWIRSILEGLVLEIEGVFYPFRPGFFFRFFEEGEKSENLAAPAAGLLRLSSYTSVFVNFSRGEFFRGGEKNFRIFLRGEFSPLRGGGKNTGGRPY